MKNTSLKSERKILVPIYILIIILPFLLLYWIMPFVADLMIGNDFHYSVHQQMEVLFSIKTGSFPLYHPAYSLGQSSVAITWSQVFHPISHLSSIMPGYWNRQALQWYTFYKLLSLGVAHLLLFMLLRKLRLNILFSFIISFVTVYNLRMLDLFRFGASLEAYTGFILLCVAISWYFIRPAGWLSPVCVIIATYLLVVSGHPQMMYYGLLGSGIYLLVAPFFMADMLPEKKMTLGDTFKFWGKSGLCLAIGILLSSVYALPFYFDFYASNSGRVGNPIGYTLAPESFFGITSNFFMPYLSEVHGAFGGSSLILLTVLLPVLRLFKVKIPRSVWVVWGIILFLIAYLLGARTPIYQWAWEYVPFISSFRNQGRVTIIMPIFLMLVLVWIMKTESKPVTIKGLSIKLTPYSILAFIGLMLIPLYVILINMLNPPLGFLPPVKINDIPVWIKAIIIISGGASLISLVLYSIYPHASRVLGVLLCLTVAVQVGVLLRFGTFMEPPEIQRTFEEMKAEKRGKFDFRSFEPVNLHSFAVIIQINNSFVEPFLGKIYSQIIPVDSQSEAYEKMRQERLPQQLFVEGYDIEKAKMISEQAKGMKEGSVKLVYSSFNRMVFRAVSQSAALFGFSYPYTGNWSARVNGERVYAYRANGAAHAVEIPAGESLIEFRYWSNAYFWGMIISCTTFALIGFFVCFRSSGGLVRIVGIIIIIIISTGVFMIWYNSLYRGDNLETKYSWTYRPPLKTPNLAYGKKVLTHYLYEDPRLQHHGSVIVDGVTRQGSYVIVEPSNEAYLIVDLYRNQTIKTILLYGDIPSKPLVSVSKDGVKWQRLAFSYAEGSHASPLRIVLEKSASAQFVNIETSDSKLNISEIEVYGDVVPWVL